MRRAIVLVALGALLSACAAGPGVDKVSIQKVLVPVATPCAADAGVKPTFADTAEAIAAVPAGDIVDLAGLYAAGRLQHYDWEARLEAANTGCKAPPPAPAK